VQIRLLVPVRGEPGSEQPGGEDQDEQDQTRDGDTVPQKASQGSRPVATRFAREHRFAEFAEWRGRSLLDLRYDVLSARNATGI